MNSDISQSSAHLLQGAWESIEAAYRPPTCLAHLTSRHLMHFVGFEPTICISVLNVLVSLEYLVRCSISPNMVKNYLSSIANMIRFHSISLEAIYKEQVRRFFRSITLNSSFAPTHRGILDIYTLYLISLACDRLSLKMN